MTLLGNAEVGFPFKPQTKDASALFWACPSETIRIQRLSGSTKQKAQGFSCTAEASCASSVIRGDNTPRTGTDVLSESVCYADVLQRERASATSMPHSTVTCRNSPTAAAHLHSVFLSIPLVLRNFYPLYKGEKTPQMDYSLLRYVSLQCLPTQGRVYITPL